MTLLEKKQTEAERAVSIACAAQEAAQAMCRFSAVADTDVVRELSSKVLEYSRRTIKISRDLLDEVRRLESAEDEART